MVLDPNSTTLSLGSCTSYYYGVASIYVNGAAVVATSSTLGNTNNINYHPFFPSVPFKGVGYGFTGGIAEVAM